VNHHTSDPVCPLCAEKLTTADPRIAEWFFEMKKEFPHAHVSGAYRGREVQEQVFKRRKRAHWPQSRHNHMEDGKPCSLVLDVFQLKNGKPKFCPNFYFTLNELTQKMGLPISWGGSFRAIMDSDHFELQE
jgi:hypothetical protein